MEKEASRCINFSFTVKHFEILYICEHVCLDL